FLCRAAGALGGSGRLAFFSTPLAPCSLLLRAFRVPLRAWTVGEHNPLASRRRPRGFAAAAVGSARRLRPFGRALPTATAAKPHGLRLAGSGLPTRAGPERPPPVGPRPVCSSSLLAADHCRSVTIGHTRLVSRSSRSAS